MFSSFKAYDMETTTQLIFHSLTQYADVRRLNTALLEMPGVKKLATKATPEGEMFDFSYQDIRFVTFFEEFGDEVIISVPKPQDPAPLIKLLTVDN